MIYDKKEFKFVSKLPDFKEFKSDNKEISPFEKFYIWLADKLGGIPEGCVIDVSKCYLEEKYCNELIEIVTKWAKKKHRLRAKRLKSSVAMLNLDIGPASFYEHTPNWVEDKSAYVRGNIFMKAKNNGS